MIPFRPAIGTFAAGAIRPEDLVFDAHGNLYVSSFVNGNVLRYDARGAFLGTFASGPHPSRGLDIGPDGNLYVGMDAGVPSEPNRILRYDGRTGALLGTFAAGTFSDGFWDVDFGPDGNLYVAAFSTDRVLQYDGTTGAPLGTFTSGGGLSGTTFMVFTRASEPSTLALMATAVLVLLCYGQAGRALR